jgi:iron complex transport system ATP-binding protein
VSAGAVLQVQGLTLGMVGRTLVRSLDFEARPGERWCIVGRNAAGKSTLLRALAGLGVPGQLGRIALGGDAQVLADPARAASLRAWLAQSASDRFELTVAEMLALHAPGDVLRPAAEPRWRAQLDQVTQALDIAPLLARPVTRLSGGERQRVGLAAIAAQEVPLWLLDEPVSFQDPAHQQGVSRWLAAQPERTIVMSAHDIAWVQRTATHLIALQADGTWAAGQIDHVMTHAVLERTFCCGWRQAGGVWLAD